ncbi:hypothetical protein AGABI1DRAFT_132448 [Agaricus bisporus var. burnettii JB137-S8]|uniref:Uncharacterized protein n=1 Tax=Agaricus bisporus var. burnettii (strain JB137-S8 / ATCC MYA-4627 / FGSC 10392) TaxID=597362 RepID=K5WWM1_AGABU|nr:uncharacterized protein AGABI1DRAFT_132448 [Agaricus bisporus var. burnettii JB137-S8]EKM75198.1 hypothetical protein AGABI1DRAFT_132448 [Agaricus bisporus var. burnettii JB137-S8]
MKPATAELALQATITILSTIFIAGFLVVQSRRQNKLIGKSQLTTPYMSVVAMLIESYAIESTWVLLFGILLQVGHPIQQFFGDTETYVGTIAYLLVLYRVANGRAYGSNRAHVSHSRRDNISSLHWNHTVTQATQSGVTSDVTDADIHPPRNKPEPDMLQV